ncbi:hypothetical protein [Leyella stercorea]|uniref:hypothetical protein n=1 Tax=Leyella stercorea TaxID=363265 RepID=UPI001F2EDCE3|nr:hypothetical protein [Leyella stercorea]MCF2615314.1 hypothetical protein [Leyella stercorea]
MGKVLIAYNNDSETVLHDFFESCADEAKQICADNGINYSSVCPPDLNEQSVVGVMPDHHLCFIAAHGDVDGIYNEDAKAVVSIHTTNYNFKDKGLYSIACRCAQNLHPHLKALGLRFFVGYNDTFNIRGEHEPFINSAMAGLKSLLSGENVDIAKEKMLTVYDEQIVALDATDPMAAIELVHNREALVFEGDNNLT